MRKLDQEMKRTDSLLYQMIPKAVADKLRRGEPATSTCEVSCHMWPIGNVNNGHKIMGAKRAHNKLEDGGGARPKNIKANLSNMVNFKKEQQSNRRAPFDVV